MNMDDIIQTIKPDPDRASHYRLLPCGNCGADQAAYVEYNHPDGPRWRVECFACGYILAPPGAALCRHDLQLTWNGGTLWHTKKT